MTCDELLQTLNEYVDGTLDLSRVECARFAEHLAGCNPCQVVVDNIRQTITLYRSGVPYELPTEFTQQLHASLQSRWQQFFPSGTATLPE